MSTKKKAKNQEMKKKEKEEKKEQEEKKKIKVIMQGLAKILHLDGWTIVIKFRCPLKDNTIAETRVDYSYRDIIIKINKKSKLERYNWFRVLSHELLHVIVDTPADTLISSAIDRITDKEKETTQKKEEAAVEQLSRVLCEILNIPTNIYVDSPDSDLQTIEFKYKDKKGGDKE